MTADDASLENLRDIVMPEPVSWWPLAPGWWVLLGCVAVGAIVTIVRLVRRWRANAYRRAALQELKSADTVAAIADVLKRTALCAWPRSDVAALSGTAWCDWLATTSHAPLPDSTTRILTNDVFRDSSTPEAVGELTTFAVTWIRQHSASGEA